METQRIILGIDPGSQQLGYGIIAITGDKYETCAAGTLNVAAYKEYTDKIRHLQDKAKEWLETYKYQEIAMEDAFYAKNAQSMLKLGRIQGAVLGLGAYWTLPVTIYSPSTIKLAIGGSGRSSKEQVAALLPHQLSHLPANLSLDASDALSVALCHGLRTAQKVNF